MTTLDLPKDLRAYAAKPEWHLEAEIHAAQKDTAEIRVADSGVHISRFPLPSTFVPTPEETSPYPLIINTPIPINEWTGELERRHCKLVEKKIMRSISPEESQELSGLQKARRRLISPRSANEVLFGIRKREKLHAIMDAMQDYITLVGIDE